MWTVGEGSLGGKNSGQICDDRVDIVDVVVRVTFLFTMCITPLGVCIVSFDHLKPKLSKSIAKVMNLVMRLNFLRYCVWRHVRSLQQLTPYQSHWLFKLPHHQNTSGRGVECIVEISMTHLEIFFHTHESVVADE